jgi:DNA-binding SARP family transcriptional activator
MRLLLLGSPRLLFTGWELALPAKMASLLAYLALEGRTERSRLARLLWGEQAEDKGRHALRQLLYRVSRSPAKDCLHPNRDYLALNPHLEVDVLLFQWALQEQHLAKALEHYQGAFLQSLDVAAPLEEWVTGWREHLHQLWLGALQGQAQALVARGELQQGLTLYRRLLQQDPLREEVHVEVIRLLDALGQRDQALCQYRELCKLLAEELSLEPLPETQALAAEIQQKWGGSPRKATPLFHPRQEVPLVECQSILNQLQAAWGEKRVLVIAGEAGIGKSRLAEAFLLGKGPFATLISQPGDSAIPYASMTRWVRQALADRPEIRIPAWVRLEVSRLVPELSPEPPPPLEQGNWMRFLTALLHLLTRVYGRSVWLLEDQHYTDLWSLRALWAGMEKEGPAKLVVTARPEELLPEVAAQYRVWGEAGIAAWVELSPWTEEQVGELVATLSGRPAKIFPKRLHQATAGNPLFVLETLRHLFETGLLRIGLQGAWETPYDAETHDYAELPIAPNIRQTILHRLALRSVKVQRCLEAASLLEEAEFGPEDLAAATLLSLPEVEEALAEAYQTRFLEIAPRGYRFTHELIARSIAEALSPERRQAISAFLARHLEKRPIHPAKVAAHYEAAQQPAEAAKWWRKAALHAHAMQAYNEAEAYYRKAIAGLPPRHPERFVLMAQHFYLSRAVGRLGLGEKAEALKALDGLARLPEERAWVWLFQALVREDQGDLEGALEASLKAYAYGREAGPSEAFYPLIFVARYHRALGLLKTAWERDLETLELAQILTPYHRGEALLGHAMTLLLLEHPFEALTLLDQSEALLEAYPPAPSSFWLLRERIGLARAMVLNRMERFSEALPHTEPFLATSRKGGVSLAELMGLLVRAEAWLGLGQTQEATEELERSLDLARALSWGWSEARQLYAELELAQGNPRAALRLAEDALLHAGGKPACRINALYSRGGALLALSQAEAARRDLEEALALHGRVNRNGSVPWQKIRARLEVTLV